MNGLSQTNQHHWNGRSSAWIETAVEGLPNDNTFDQCLVNNAQIKPGDDILDIAAGTGDPAISVGVALKGQSTIIACDLTSAMLDVAVSRAQYVGIEKFSCASTDMMSLSFRDESFDCVTCRFGLMFAPNKVEAAREALRVLKPGGRAAYMVWGAYSDNPAFFIIRQTIADVLNQTEGPPPQRHCLGDKGQLVNILKKAGYRDTKEVEIRYRRPVENLDQYIGRALSRGYSDSVERLNKSDVANLVKNIKDRFKVYKENNKIFIPNRALIGIGYKR